MSALATLYSTLAAVTVTASGTTPTAYDVGSLPQSAETAGLPMRLLLPFGRSGGADANLLTFSGRLATIEWRIVDTMLWRPVAQGQGLSTVAPDLVAYMAAYITALRSADWPACAQLIDVEMTPGIIEWPSGAGRAYFGVTCVVTLKEMV